MRTHLVPHPTSPRVPAQISVDVQREVDRLHLRYHLQGARAMVRLPTALGGPDTQREPIDGLWQTTCCELFVRTPVSLGYWEYNFAPSGAWACYGFSAERDGMSALVPDFLPEISLESTGEDYIVSVRNVWLAPALQHIDKLLAGLTCVIETLDADKSYWALNHPRPAPDFHHPLGHDLLLSA